MKELFICLLLLFLNGILTDIFEEHVLEERYPNLDEEGDIKITDSREEHWIYVVGYGYNRRIIHALRWYL